MKTPTVRSFQLTTEVVKPLNDLKGSVVEIV